MSRVLTVYYSRKGENYFPGGIKSVAKGYTEYAAEYIQDAVGGDLFEIDTVKPYAADYKACCNEAVAELNANARPAIKGYVDDISKYDAIFVCYPNWCGTMPMCVFTFLEHYDMTGKKIIPLCTSGGSGLGRSEQDIKACCIGADVVPGLAVLGHQTADSQTEISAWAKAALD